jgi:hypothetical protein
VNAVASWLIAVIVVAGTAATAWAEPDGERLILPIPQPFKPAGEIKGVNGAGGQIYRPPGQTDDNWMVQIVVESGPARPGVEPTQLLRALDAVTAKNCKDHAPMTILPGRVNGYATATTYYKCPLDTASGKPESSVIHVIAGTDKNYMIFQVARALLTKDQIRQMIAYLGTVKLCDTRSSEHPCP